MAQVGHHNNLVCLIGVFTATAASTMLVIPLCKCCGVLLILEILTWDIGKFKNWNLKTDLN